MLTLSVLLAIEGSWSIGIFHHWTFITVIVLVIIALGLTSINDFSHKSLSAFLSHSGLFLVLAGGLFGAPDSTDAMMKVYLEGRKEHIAIDANGNAVPLPFSVLLEDFKIDCYQDGISPKQYTSTLSIDGRTTQTSVNHPCRYKGYRIYQSSYGIDSGRYSVLKIVRDPWLPVVDLGALILLFGALLSLKTVWRNWKILVAVLLLAVVFALISLERISFSTLPPALRSLWFIPHLIVYMLAYSILALAVVSGFASLFSTKVPYGLPEKLLSTASSLLLIGMMCGAVWAKQAWGDYWTWDAKECWAAATWLLTLAGTHVQGKGLRFSFAVIAFLAMQMTWYGVNYLPSSMQSLHTYNQEKTI
ncbi:MAG: cytochrome c biogenesis protein ResB [Bacteroidales bacterium]|nr:cytochrome c biogenesis protein ResB [Candidatus Cacconaster merdequi]